MRSPAISQPATPWRSPPRCSWTLPPAATGSSAGPFSGTVVRPRARRHRAESEASHGSPVALGRICNAAPRGDVAVPDPTHPPGSRAPCSPTLCDKTDDADGSPATRPGYSCSAALRAGGASRNSDASTRSRACAMVPCPESKTVSVPNRALQPMVLALARSRVRERSHD